MSEENNNLEEIKDDDVEEIAPDPVVTEDNSESKYAGDVSATAQKADNGDGNGAYAIEHDNNYTVGRVLAIVSLVCGILSCLCCCMSYLGFVCAIAAIVCGIISIKKDDSLKTMAVIGIVLGAVGGALVTIGILCKGTAVLFSNLFEGLSY